MKLMHVWHNTHNKNLVINNEKWKYIATYFKYHAGSDNKVEINFCLDQVEGMAGKAFQIKIFSMLCIFATHPDQKWHHTCTIIVA